MEDLHQRVAHARARRNTRRRDCIDGQTKYDAVDFAKGVCYGTEAADTLARILVKQESVWGLSSLIPNARFHWESSSLELIRSFRSRAARNLTARPPNVMSNPIDLRKSLFILGVEPSITAYASANDDRESLKNSWRLSTGTAIHCWLARWNETVPSAVARRRKSQWPEKYCREPRMGYVREVQGALCWLLRFQAFRARTRSAKDAATSASSVSSVEKELDAR
ncbi:hypothetical protein B0H14DRAFT_3555275 [Mycena olivaceomarginata]|nr:hypothetical protein B0H14DRAFT_3555275 [Mycena olivaceomarginata]